MNFYIKRKEKVFFFLLYCEAIVHEIFETYAKFGQNRFIFKTISYDMVTIILPAQTRSHLLVLI